LVSIAEKVAQDKEIHFSPESFAIIREMITEAYRDRDKSFGNARFVEDLLERSKQQMAMRVMNRKKPSRLTRSELSEIQVSDVISLRPQIKGGIAEIPIDEVLLQESLQALDALTGIENVKERIHEMVNLVRFYRETGRNVLSGFSMHSILVGNPGTGKTTVARILARIYKALGILERGHIVETDRQGLVAGYVGQTALKTNEKIDEAIGGVLFIDEAYALTSPTSQGDFGAEAIQTLLKRMEDQRGMFFVIVAGYPDNMDTFLKANPGLSSRFDKTYHFQDYTPAQLEEIGVRMAESEGYSFSVKARESFAAFLSNLYQKRDKYFGNGRVVRKLITEICKNQNLRTASIPLTRRKKSTIHQIEQADIQQISAFADSEGIERKSIGFRKKDQQSS